MSDSTAAASSADPAVADPQPDTVTRHSLLEDALALLCGTLLIALAVRLVTQVGLLSGGTSGLAFLLHYGAGWDFGPVFFVLNLPFLGLAWRRMGRAFTIKTVIAVALLSLETMLIPQWLVIERIAPLFAAVIGGLLMGTGFLILFRHRASLGGVGILALVLQERRGWRAGHVQMAVDLVIVVLALLLVEPQRVLLSIVGAVALNQVLAINHRPGRYVAQ